MRMWKRCLMLAGLLLAGLVRADLPSAAVSVVWTKGEDSAGVPGLFWAGSSVPFTNCVVYAAQAVGTNAPTVQDLSGLGGFLTLGGVSWTNAFPTAPVVILTATSGTFAANLTLPAWSNLVQQAGSAVTLCPVFLTLTNTTGGRFAFPGSKVLTVARPWGP